MSGKSLLSIEDFHSLIIQSLGQNKDSYNQEYTIVNLPDIHPFLARQRKS